jgi:hypothetical protein
LSEEIEYVFRATGEVGATEAERVGRRETVGEVGDREVRYLERGVGLLSATLPENRGNKARRSSTISYSLRRFGASSERALVLGEGFTVLERVEVNEEESADDDEEKFEEGDGRIRALEIVEPVLVPVVMPIIRRRTLSTLWLCSLSRSNAADLSSS